MSGYELSWYEMSRYEMSGYEMSVPHDGQSHRSLLCIIRAALWHVLAVSLIYIKLPELLFSNIHDIFESF